MKLDRATIDLGSNPRKRLKKGMNSLPPPTPTALYREASNQPKITAVTNL